MIFFVQSLKAVYLWLDWNWEDISLTLLRSFRSSHSYHLGCLIVLWYTAVLALQLNYIVVMQLYPCRGWGFVSAPFSFQSRTPLKSASRLQSLSHMISHCFSLRMYASLSCWPNHHLKALCLSQNCLSSLHRSRVDGFVCQSHFLILFVVLLLIDVSLDLKTLWQCLLILGQ